MYRQAFHTPHQNNTPAGSTDRPFTPHTKMIYLLAVPRLLAHDDNLVSLVMPYTGESVE